MNNFPFFKSNIKGDSKNLRLSEQSRLLLFYGLFAILCQLSLIFLHTRIYAECVVGALLSIRFAPMLEYTMMSLVILFVGVYLIERTHLEKR